ncbi:hypothetical protein SDRG_05377 [Saprolegnia diclina VS20]|uniref:C3H1-type domain-containing protein n=1 Tax=Saprolegnia diclina (strain VS20) TaxID=1156394 RepID=T0QT14_SAPDV|nr:hypothetical protein SDRG_05377 [Saprolegnia diclina VS20]EQC37150.1 hypothetical protein SDRG_05377 [Saprolegnia diclina VS20]|eukprot:XP_008609312.1 hypothetical protein SDRG_05377 [Saprolegnia diclina VS20]
MTFTPVANQDALSVQNPSRHVAVVDIVDAIGESVQEALRRVVMAYGRDCAVDCNVPSDVETRLAAAEAAKAAADEKVALQSLLIKKLKQELVRERTVAFELQKDRVAPPAPAVNAGLKDEQGRPSVDASAATSAADPWDSPPKPFETKPPTAPGLLGFRFYSATPVTDDDDDAEQDPQASPSPLSTSLRNSNMGQFLPSSLLDSPCVMPATAATMHSALLTKLPTADAFSLDGAKPDAEAKDRSSLSSRRTTSNSSNDDSVDSDDSSASSNNSTLSMLQELFDGISLDDLQDALRASNGEVAKTMDYLLKHHASLKPSVAPLPAAKPEFRAASSNWKTEMCMYYLQGKCNKTRRTCSFAHGESDLVRNPNVSAANNATAVSAKVPAATTPVYKTRLCPLYLEGQCPKARRECLLAHGESDLVFREPPSQSVVNVAPLPLPNPAPRLQNYKTELCYYFLKGCCNYSTDECRFAHGEADLRTVESNTIEWGAMDATMLLQGSTLEYQLQYQQQAPHHHHHHHMHPTPPPPPPSTYRYMVKDEMAKRRVTLPARRDSLNHLPTPPQWSTPAYDY